MVDSAERSLGEAAIVVSPKVASRKGQQNSSLQVFQRRFWHQVSDPVMVFLYSVVNLLVN